ncbi:MAG: DUF1189 family protein [Alphaproteobacteria bacterium]|nr:DUF1189 family protein [Alphaproteobacteria bacterium]
MKKIAQYIKSGKGRGLKLVFFATLLLSVIFGTMTYYVGQKFFKNQMITEFVDSVPTFVIKDGAIQNNNIKWGSFIPMTRIPVIIDTTQESISLPVPDGFYVTRSAMFSVADRGTRVDRAPLPDAQLVSPTYVYSLLRRFVFSFAVGIFIFFFIVSWIAYLLAVLLTAFFAWLVRAKLATHRAWRVAAVTWVLGLLLSLILAFGGLVYSTWAICFITVIINVIILARFKD